MLQRIITAIAIIVVAIPLVIIGGWPFMILLLVAIIVATNELLKLVNTEWNKFFKYSIYVLMLLLCFSWYVDGNYFIFMDIFTFIYLCTWLIVDENVNFEEVGLVYLFANILGFTIAGLTKMYTYSFIVTIYMVIAAVGCDTFAYFTGRFFGKHKLNERISPKKTIEGAVGGYLITAILLIVFGIFVVQKQFETITTLFIIVSALTLPIITQIGDLTFSAIKRHYGVKDFGHIFPGHGGVLDRLDSISFACCWMYALMVILL